MEDVRPVSGVRGDGQRIAIGDMEEIGYHESRRTVETTEIAVDAVESQSSTWGFLRGSQDSLGLYSARVGQVTGVCTQPKSSMQPSGVLLAHHFSQVAQELHTRH